MFKGSSQAETPKKDGEEKGKDFVRLRVVRDQSFGLKRGEHFEQVERDILRKSTLW